MAENHAIVTYTTAPSFLPTGAWKQIQNALKAQFPLRNIHWKPPSRPSILTIQELEVKLIPFENFRDEHASQIPMTLLEKPLLHIYVVTCEPGDLDTYKATVKKQVKDWHTAVASRKHQEWLILHLVKGDTPVPSGGKLFQLKGSVLDKLKTDFNQDKRDRCIQVTWSTANDSPLAWGEFGNKVKDSLMSAFDVAVGHREEEIRRSESQQQMPGWNFCTFFILKESLASSFEGMNLLEEALLQCDELEESFNHIWREKNFSWFGPLINASPGDDTLPLLSVTKKPYRDLILANTISVFDLRIFILGRQCELLAKLGRINDIATSALSFLARFGLRLRTIADSLPLFFIESWIYSSSISIVQQYDVWFPAPTDGSKPSTLLYASKGELYEASRRQASLDKMGVQVGHLPSKPPFSANLPSISTHTDRNSEMSISNQDLLDGVHDCEAFYKLYIDITNRAISMYTKAGRRKSALKLHGSLAALDLYRAQYDNALTTFSSLPAHYAPHTWTALESYMLSQALDTHAEMEQPKDNEWMHNLLLYLRSFIEHQGSELLVHDEDKAEYISGLVSYLTKAANSLESEIVLPEHQIISLEIAPDAELAENQDGAFVNVSILNRLPSNLSISSVTMIASDRESEKYKFTASSLDLAPGKNILRLFCPDIHALDISVDQSTQIELGKPPTVLLTVSPGRNRIDRLKLRLACPNITWRYSEACAEDAASHIEAGEDGLVLHDLSEDREYSFILPHSDASALHDLKIKFALEYVTKDQPSLERKLFLMRVLFTTLPISVNVQDFFRGHRLVSKFTVSTTSHQHIRIASAELEMPPNGIDGVTITSPSSSNSKIVTVTPLQPANFLFSIDSSSGPVQESLTLVIKYRLLRTEVKDLIEKEVEKVVAEDEPRGLYTPLVSHLIEALGADTSWVELYGVTGELAVPEMPNDSDLGSKLTVVKETLARHQHSENLQGNWREIRIPVDVPQMHIVAAARINILATPFGDVTSPASLYAGQPISAELKIDTSFHWGPSANNRTQGFVMRYNVEETIRDWLISGPKRGEFVAKDGSSFSTQVTLLALHHGELALPQINILALPMTGEASMGSIPTTEVFQAHGGERILILPRGGRSTFVVGMGAA
ncbi:Trafficking protein particle complex subunit 10 [Leucoagaricus sp. SymC.cos]|nr:Trafficking protein particle complex subunit 10 [Leucoagaricus sp. SymC.cos]